MADGFIVRKGGVADATPPPTIKFVSKTDTSITFTITNNSLKARDITHGLTTPPTTTTINLAALATSSNQTISNITQSFVTIFAQAEDSAITEFRVRLEFPNFTAATGGTTLEYDSGGKRFKSHTFTSNGNFVVSTVGDNIDDRNKVDYLIIAGGASGGATAGSGGGAGGYRTTFGTQGGLGTLDPKVTVTANTFGVTIGAGGASQSSVDAAGNNGQNTTVAFPSSIVSTGGGGGGTFGITSASKGKDGGSGGGGGRGSAGSTDAGLGTANQGFDGGEGSSDNGGAGGGAGQVGDAGSANAAIFADGGDGLASTIRTGSSETRAGGGGNCKGFNQSGAGVGGAGGGGNGGNNTGSVNATAGTTNTGSGGGGAKGASGDLTSASGAGGSGIVIIRYEIAPSV